QGIAGGIAVRVVDLLEAVEIEEADRGGLAPSSNPRLLGGERLGERVTVRRGRERVDASPRALCGEGPLEAQAESVPQRDDEQQAGGVRKSERQRALDQVDEDDEKRCSDERQGD